MIKKTILLCIPIFLIFGFSFAGLEEYCFKIDSDTVPDYVEEIVALQNEGLEFTSQGSCINKRCCARDSGPNIKFGVVENGVYSSGFYDWTFNHYGKNKGYTTDFKADRSNKTITSYYGRDFYFEKIFNDYVEFISDKLHPSLAIVIFLLSFLFFVFLSVSIIPLSILGVYGIISLIIKKSKK